jgi:hypothetical protein
MTYQSGISVLLLSSPVATREEPDVRQPIALVIASDAVPLREMLTGLLDQHGFQVIDGDADAIPDVAVVHVRMPPDAGLLDSLTEREREILALIAQGRSNQAICRRLTLTKKTVESHVRNILLRLGLRPEPDDHRRVLAALTYLRRQVQS